jgi:hypothetical protein
LYSFKEGQSYKQQLPGTTIKINAFFCGTNTDSKIAIKVARQCPGPNGSRIAIHRGLQNVIVAHVLVIEFNWCACCADWWLLREEDIVGPDRRRGRTAIEKGKGEIHHSHEESVASVPWGKKSSQRGSQ